MFFEADLHLQLHIKFETPSRSLHRLKLPADVRKKASPKLHPLRPLYLLDLALYLYLRPAPYLLYSYARGFRANWVSAHSNLERLATDSIGFSVLKMALI